MVRSFTIDHRLNSETDLGLRITTPPSLTPSRRVVDRISVPGRENGTLTRLGGFEDRTFTLQAGVRGSKAWQAEVWRKAAVQLAQGRAVSFSHDRGVYYRVKTCQVGPLEERLASLGFTIEFVCEPFAYINPVPADLTLTMRGHAHSQTTQTGE